MNMEKQLKEDSPSGLAIELIDGIPHEPQFQVCQEDGTGCHLVVSTIWLLKHGMATK